MAAPLTPTSGPSALPEALEAMAKRVASTPGGEAERVQALRAEALAAAGGKIPASAAEAYAGALRKVAGGAGGGGAALRATLERGAREEPELRATIGLARGTVRGLEGRLESLRSDNLARYQSSVALIDAIRNELASVLTDRRASEEKRVGAFFQLATGNQRQRLDAAWKSYQAKQGQLQGELEGLKRTEAALEQSAAADGAEGLLLGLARRQQGLEALVSNLESQVQLLRQLITHAAGAGQALSGVEQALQKELAACKAWVAEAQAASVGQLLAYAAGLGGFLALFSGAPAMAVLAEAMGLVRSLVLQDVEGVRAEAEALAWRTVGRLIAGGLIEAGMSEALARTLVTGLRATAQAAFEADRQEARGLVSAAVRAGLGEAQRQVVDFLLTEANPALPLASLVKSVLALHALSPEQGRSLIGALRDPVGTRPSSGLDAALAMLEAAAR